MGGKPGWGEGACSAGGVDEGAGVDAVHEHFEQAVLRPGLWVVLHVD